MAWTPIFSTVDFGVPIIGNLQRIIERDQVEALRWANGGTEMTAFARILLSERVAQKFPSLAIFPRGDAATVGDDEQSVTQELELLFEIAVSGGKPNDLTIELMRRVTALRMIVLTATEADVMQGVGVPNSGLIVELGQTFYEQLREHETQNGLYYRSAYCLMTFKFHQGGY
ncbi:MAG TPA: hypothetical protein PLD20_24395 [Blastocatellia bacterium]|nr:hypothetical protein [Blastocatellia bacterium]HMY75188.1 hypothetical protein [Blastocatellia bacterium]HMZ21096.1 hypothetical protein [Blastocatellia bacterium]HNG34068.1 hypothetical protein [Blastocatellia bacterium]